MMALFEPGVPLGWKKGVLLCSLLFGGAFYLFTRHNSFSGTYHPDEDSKVRQIISGNRNFYHPLLLLSTTDAVIKTGRIPKNPASVVVAGRSVSATFTALGIVALAILATRWVGLFGGATAAILMTFNPLVLELAHYFKEDPALFLGIAVSLLAMDLFRKSPGRGTATLLGIGCALAISGKYLGAILLLFVLPLLLTCNHQKKRQVIIYFAAGCLLLLVIINMPIILSLNSFQHGLEREIEGATEGHRGLGRNIPHAYYFGRLWELTPWGLWGGCVAVAGFVFIRRYTLSITQWVCLAFPILFLAILSFSPKTAGRYLLPVEALLAFWAAIGFCGLIFDQQSGRTPVIWKAFAFIALQIALVTTAIDSAGYYREFSNDSRTTLRSWITSHTVSGSIIAQDGRVGLGADADWGGRILLSAEYVPDLGSLADLRARGVTYIVVARPVYNRFINEQLRPGLKEKADFDRRAAFYRELFSRCEKVWESPLGKVVYLHPGFRVYALGAP